MTRTVHIEIEVDESQLPEDWQLTVIAAPAGHDVAGDVAEANASALEEYAEATGRELMAVWDVGRGEGPEQDGGEGTALGGGELLGCEVTVVVCEPEVAGRPYGGARQRWAGRLALAWARQGQTFRLGQGAGRVELAVETVEPPAGEGPARVEMADVSLGFDEETRRARRMALRSVGLAPAEEG